MAKMSPYDAWLYAASWGSYMTSGDPGACMYGFDEKFVMQSEQHRADVLEQMKANRAYVEANRKDYAADELDQIDSFVETVKAAPVAP